jgi:hypothetical protein
MISFYEWLGEAGLARQDEMGLANLRLNPDISLHPGERKILGGEKIKRCLEEKFARLDVPVHIVVDPKPTPEDLIPDPNAIKFVMSSRGGDPMTCWMILHRLGHLMRGLDREVMIPLYKWGKLYRQYHPEWAEVDADLKYPLSKFLMFTSARKTASVINRWKSGSISTKGLAIEPGHGPERHLRSAQHYDAFEPKSYALREEFEHELVAEYIWNGRIRFQEDPKDPFVKENPGYMARMFEQVGELIKAQILALKGKVMVEGHV